MKTATFITGSLFAGLAAALLAGAFFGQSTDYDPDRFLVSRDIVTIAGAIGGALCLGLAAHLFYRGARSK